jgi:hypothetical protein
MTQTRQELLTRIRVAMDRQEWRRAKRPDAPACFYRMPNPAGKGTIGCAIGCLLPPGFSDFTEVGAISGNDDVWRAIGVDDSLCPFARLVQMMHDNAPSDQAWYAMFNTLAVAEGAGG